MKVLQKKGSKVYQMFRLCYLLERCCPDFRRRQPFWMLYIRASASRGSLWTYDSGYDTGHNFTELSLHLLDRQYVTIYNAYAVGCYKGDVYIKIRDYLFVIKKTSIYFGLNERGKLTHKMTQKNHLTVNCVNKIKQLYLNICNQRHIKVDIEGKK